MTSFVRILAISMAALVAVGCGSRPASNRVPITTCSDEARQAYLESRDLFDRLRVNEARAAAERALELDDRFAMAHLMIASTSGSTTEFFKSLERAENLVDEVSEGERLVILGFAAGSRGDLEAQQSYYQSLVLAFPEDERAHHLLAGHFFEKQEWHQAIEHYRRAIELNPEFSAPYNQLGYALRFIGEYDEAEKAFREYARLMPDEPNPLDSYAELLMHQGRFEESIEKYREAIERNPGFVPSYIGIGNNLIFMGEPAEARKTFSLLAEVASTDVDRRRALMWTAVSYLHEGRYEDALAAANERLEIAKRNGDLIAASDDLLFIGDIHLEAGSLDAALASYRESMDAGQHADSPEEVRKATLRKVLYHEGRVALARNDLEKARTIANRYGDLVGQSQVPAERRSQRELVGLVSLAEGDFESAVSHLEKAGQTDPRVLYELALAYRGAGELAEARDLAERAAKWNGLSVNYAYVRHKAATLVEELGGNGSAALGAGSD